MFARAVNENSVIKSAMKDFVLYKVDCEKGEGVALAKKYAIRAYPTFIAMNGKGEITDSWVGYGGPDAWSKTALAAAADPRTLNDKRVAFENKPTAGLARCLAAAASTGGDFPAAVKYYGKARELDAANAVEYTHEILMSMYYGSRDGMFTFDEVEAEAKMVLVSGEASVSEQIELTMMLRNMARNAGIAERAVPYIESALKASKDSTDEKIVRSRTHLEIDYALLVEKDSQKALKLFKSTLEEGWMENANKLNNFAWWCFENNVNLEEAQAMALKGIELAETDGGQANILDTLAEICNKLGDCEEAVDHMKRAVELDPDKQYFQDQLVRFEKALEEKQNG